MQYTVEFKDGRVGRSRGHDEVEIKADGPNHLNAEIFRFVRPLLVSRDIEVTLYTDDELRTGQMRGLVTAGFQTVAQFTVTEEEDD